MRMTANQYHSVFDIIGPVMIGPSSSHTAGAARIGKIIRTIFGEKPEQVEIWLYDSFAKTYRGHGTDIALVGGLLGMEPDDPKLSDSLKLAHEAGIEVLFVPKKEAAEHPNSVKILLTKGSYKMSATGISIGGGNIQISELNGFKISFTVGVPTLIVVQQDVPGVIAEISNFLFDQNINIGTMSVTRDVKVEKAITIIETDERPIDFQKLLTISNVHNVTYFD